MVLYSNSQFRVATNQSPCPRVWSISASVICSRFKANVITRVENPERILTTFLTAFPNLLLPQFWLLASFSSLWLYSPSSLASPDNFNPGLSRRPAKTRVNRPISLPLATQVPKAEAKPELQQPVAKSPEPPPSKTAESPSPATTIANNGETAIPAITFVGTSNDTQRLQDNNGQVNQYTRQTIHSRLRNGDSLDFTVGYEEYQQKDIETVTNIPIAVTWKGTRGDFSLTAGVGLDVFNRFSSEYNIKASVSSEVRAGMNLTASVERGSYKFNAETIAEGITAWRYGPNLYWQIAPELSLFSLFRWGNYSDGNVENQSFSRIEKRFGQFAVAGNLFTWRYSNSDLGARNGYFAPTDFLVYSGELSWNGEIFPDLLKCRAAASLGEQRVEGSPSGAVTYEGLCTTQISSGLEVDIGYKYSTIRSRGGQKNEPTETFIGKLRWMF